MRKLTKSLITTATLFVLLIATTPTYNAPLYAQCPMCKMAAESNLKGGGSVGKGLNKGILFMLTAPYILVAAIGFVWWRNRKKQPSNHHTNFN